MCRGGSRWETSSPSSQFWHEPKTAPPQKKPFKTKFLAESPSIASAVLPALTLDDSFSAPKVVLLECLASLRFSLWWVRDPALKTESPRRRTRNKASAPYSERGKGQGLCGWLGTEWGPQPGALSKSHS